MYKSELIQYLSGSITPEVFLDLINDELNHYSNALKKKGSSVPIKFDGDLEIIEIKSENYEKMMNDYLNNKVDKFFLSYVADALLLSENSFFENEELKDKFESLTEL